MSIEPAMAYEDECILVSRPLRERERERERFTTSIGPARPMRTNPCSCPRLIWNGNDKIRQGLQVPVPHQVAYGIAGILQQASILSADISSSCGHSNMKCLSSPGACRGHKVHRRKYLGTLGLAMRPCSIGKSLYRWPI